MVLETLIDNYKSKHQIILTVIIIIIIMIGVCLEFVGPHAYSYHNQCAFNCTDGNNNEFNPDTCEGVNFGEGEVFEVELTPLSPINRINKVYMVPFLHSEKISVGYEIIYLELEANISLYYKENDEWTLWNGGVFLSKLSCYGYDVGECQIVNWIDEPYFMHSEQKLVVQLLNPKNTFANVCLTQIYGSDAYGISKVIYTLFFTCLTVGYIIYYFIYLFVKKISLKDLDGQQALNIGLMIFALCYNDPLSLLNLVLPSPFFPIMHGILHLSFIGYLVFFVVAFFELLRGETALVSKKVEWTIVIITTLGMIISFAFASSTYLKGITENPFNITLKTGAIAWFLYCITVVCCIGLAVWLMFIFFSSYKILLPNPKNMRKCMYFCLTSVVVVAFEMALLLFSDYSSFFNAVSTPVMVMFAVNAYIFAMFFAFVPRYSTFNDNAIIQNYDEEEKPFLLVQDLKSENEKKEETNQSDGVLTEETITSN